MDPPSTLLVDRAVGETVYDGVPPLCLTPNPTPRTIAAATRVLPQVVPTAHPSLPRHSNKKSLLLWLWRNTRALESVGEKVWPRRPPLFFSLPSAACWAARRSVLTTRRICRWFVLEGGFLKYYYAKDDHGINAQPKARKESARDPCDPLGPCRSSRWRLHDPTAA